MKSQVRRRFIEISLIVVMIHEVSCAPHNISYDRNTFNSYDESDNSVEVELTFNSKYDKNTLNDLHYGNDALKYVTIADNDYDRTESNVNSPEINHKSITNEKTIEKIDYNRTESNVNSPEINRKSITNDKTIKDIDYNRTESNVYSPEINNKSMTNDKTIKNINYNGAKNDTIDNDKIVMETTTEYDNLSVIPLNYNSSTTILRSVTETIIKNSVKPTDQFDFSVINDTKHSILDLNKQEASSNDYIIENSTVAYNLTTEIVNINTDQNNLTAKNDITEKSVILKKNNTIANNITKNSTNILTDNDKTLNSTIVTDNSTIIESDESDDYYDREDTTTKAPANDPLSMIFGLATSVAETVAERILPKSIFDIIKRLQKQSEALEIERLRSPEENGGIGNFGRGLIKSISTTLTRPINTLLAGVRDIGSLDTDRGFVTGLSSGVAQVADGVATVANSLAEAFKDRVQAIYPGTLWCGGGRVNDTAGRELGLFYMTDTCCKEHDTCKLYIPSGETKFGLTNTGLFTRSHCSCDEAFRDCLKKTNSLISNQIGLTYFNVLGPQCFRKTYPIVRCLKRTRLTGQKCEQYEFDYRKEKMWQWFDNETF